MAAPSQCTKERVERICALLAEGKPLTEICREDADLPTPTTVRNWQRTHEWVATAVAIAREVGFDAIAEEALRIADTPREGIETVEVNGQPIETRRGDMLQHRKLQVDTRLKLLAKWDPKRYGDRVQLANDPNNPLPAPQFIIQPVKPAASE